MGKRVSGKASLDLKQATPPGLSRWFNGFCASRLLISSELQVAQKPLNP